jgi:hypothetical protein
MPAGTTWRLAGSSPGPRVATSYRNVGELTVNSSGAELIAFSSRKSFRLCAGGIGKGQQLLNHIIRLTARQLQAIAQTHTPVVVIDHDVIRENYAKFKNIY